MTSDSRELFLLPDDHNQYSKLHSAAGDLSSASQYGSFIRKKGWKAKPWSRGHTYIQQTAFVTAMITSYGRAFNKSQGLGRWAKLPPEMLDIYDKEELDLHKMILTKRDKIYAHTDAETFTVRPWKSDLHSDIMSISSHEMAHSDIERLQAMCRKMMDHISVRMEKIKSTYY